MTVNRNYILFPKVTEEQDNYYMMFFASIKYGILAVYTDIYIFKY